MGGVEGISPERLVQGLSLIFAVILLLTPVRWQNCIKTVLVILVLEGAIRKWLLPGLSQFVYFGKDFIILIAYAKYFSSIDRSNESALRDRALNFLLLVCTIAICVNAANPNLGSPLIGLIGIRNYLIYVPLVMIVPKLFNSQEELARFLRWYIVLVLPVTALALAQYFSPPTSALNTYVSSEDTAKAMIGMRVRTTGTFSYIAGYAAYLQVMTALTIPLLIIAHTMAWTWIFRLTLLACLTGTLMTGSRAPVISLIVFLLGYFTLNRVFRSLGLYKKFIFPIVLIAIILLSSLGEVLGGFYDRFVGGNDLPMRIAAALLTPFGYIEHAGVFGFGTGSTYQANGRIRELFDLPSGTTIPVFFESEPERIMLELGPFVFLLWYVMKARLCFLLWNTYKMLTFPLLRELALTSFLVHITSMVAQVVFQVTFNVYFWFLAGFIFLLPRLERIEQENEMRELSDGGGMPGLDYETTQDSIGWNEVREPVEDDDWRRRE